MISCPSGKVAYDGPHARQAAIDELNRETGRNRRRDRRRDARRRKRQTMYRCALCGAWHVTTQEQR